MPIYPVVCPCVAFYLDYGVNHRLDVKATEKREFRNS